MLSGFTTVADANKCKMYIKNFGEFYCDQIEHAGCIVLSHTDGISEEKLEACINLLRQHNLDAVIVTTPWSQLTGAQLLDAMERKSSLDAVLKQLAHEEDICPECGHHHGEHEHHHHDHDEHEHHHNEHEHEHHHHDEHCDCHEHKHDHDEHEHHHHDEHCDCHEHHHHHADDVFTSWGVETTHKYTPEQIEDILRNLENTEKYGMVLRAKGIVQNTNGSWIHFDYIPGEPDVRTGAADIIGRICVIGSGIDKHATAELFGISE